MSNRIEDIIRERVLLLDGGLGTLIQSHKLTEEDYRGAEFSDHRLPLTGCNDLLVLTQPEIIRNIHRDYYRSGADIVSTNTFNANAVSMVDYALESEVYRINYAAARLARQAAEEFETIEKPRFVAGSVGPTNRSASMSPEVERPAYRNVTFDELAATYAEQMRGLIDGGADIILVETVFDTLNCKAAIFALRHLLGRADFPLMISGTITDASGRTLSGQTIEAFYESVKHANLLTIGLNCAFGARQLLPYIEQLSRLATCGVSAHPNAGLPNVMGGYDESAAQMAVIIEEYLKAGAVNIVGGCCGTTPEHIREMATIVALYAPRQWVEKERVTTLAGLEPLYITKEANFVNVGERTNVAGSAKFARLIREEHYQEALSVAAEQVEGGAQIIDVCMDAPMIEAHHAMTEFLNLMASEPDISRLPVMIDSSDWSVLEAGLKCTQGKSVVNSISLKEGEAEFLRKALLIKNYGAAAVVMLFDERGQADSYERKIEVAKRAYAVLTEAGFEPTDIIFDPNVLAVATGIEEHNDYGRAFIEACRWIKENCSGAKVSGGVSNLSFSYRGNNTIREAMHSVFLYHATKAGMDMGIVNPSMLQIYSEIEPQLLELIEDVVLNRRSDAGERLTEYAGTLSSGKDATQGKSQAQEQWRNYSLAERVKYALVKGVTTHIEEDIMACYHEKGSAIEVIDNVLMDGMGEVGALFSTGKMFLPQVVKSARVMKQAVAVLEPFIIRGEESQKGAKIVIATVKGDVHDIGKNIVSIVLQCNGYRVVDLGVMTPAERIVEAAQREKADMVLLSGLITPSLEEMRIVAQSMERAGLANIPIAVGGATTSALHTAVKIASHYSGVVAHSTDASSCVRLVSDVLTMGRRFTELYQQKQQQLREEYSAKQSARRLVPIAQARAQAPKFDFSKIAMPRHKGRHVLKNYPIERLIDHIDWSYLFAEWDIRGRYPEILNHPQKGEEARKLIADAKQMLESFVANGKVSASAVVAIVDARSEGEDILIKSCSCGSCAEVRLVGLRNQSDNFGCVSDFVAPKGDHVALFALGIENNTNFEDPYHKIMAQVLCDRLAEAFAQHISALLSEELWGFEGEGLRVAYGYPTAPEHSPKRVLFDLLQVEESIPLRLTENYMMQPTAAVSGVIFAHPDARYFNVGVVAEDQLSEYAQRSRIDIDRLKVLMPNNVL